MAVSFRSLETFHRFHPKSSFHGTTFPRIERPTVFREHGWDYSCPHSREIRGMSYTSFDQITQADVNQMGQAFIRRGAEIRGLEGKIWRHLAVVGEGSRVNHLDHSRQPATGAVRDGATEEMVI